MLVSAAAGGGAGEQGRGLAVRAGCGGVLRVGRAWLLLLAQARLLVCVWCMVQRLWTAPAPACSPPSACHPSPSPPPALPVYTLGPAPSPSPPTSTPQTLTDCPSHLLTPLQRCAPASLPEFKALLNKIWFEMYRRGAEADSSGFEHVFLGESKNGDITGLHNWVQVGAWAWHG